jgi:hypothetical protein
MPDGNTTCAYEYEIGNEPSAGRAAFHGAMDVMTLGLWEVVGTPIEGFQGEKRRVTIIYDKDNKVAAINSVPLATQTKQSQATNEQATLPAQ